MRSASGRKSTVAADCREDKSLTSRGLRLLGRPANANALGLSNAAKAGVAVFVGSVQFGICLILSEIIYSTSGPLGTSGSGNTTGYIYSVANNYVSDLGANCRTACTSVPSGYLFDSSIALFGVLVIVGAYFLQKAYQWRPATIMVALAGVGALGVGLFPETTGIWHDIFSLIVFLFAGLSALVTARFQMKPMFYFSILLGLGTLVALVLYIGGAYLGLGPGGMERMVVYPALLWAVAFGGHLMALDDKAQH